MSKDLVTGALITCLAVSVCALVPIVGLIGSAFLPVPLLFYRIKLGRQAVAIIALAGLGNTVLLASGLEVFFFGELLLIGLVLGELMARGWSLERTAGAVCGTVLGVGLAGLWTYSHLNGKGLQDTLSEGLRYNLELTIALYREMGVSQDQLVFLESSIEVIEQVLIGMLPALVIGSTLMVVWISLLTARRVFQRRGLSLPNYGPLDCWKAPDVLVWGVIASGALLLIPSFMVKMVGLNGLLVFMVIYFFQGMAIIAFFFRKKRIPRAAQIVLYTLVILQQIVMLAVIVVGFFDTWFNFRKLGKPLVSS
jgi:uncharacterized protein YybS (DUF2232 family)